VRDAQLFNAIELGELAPSFHRPGQHLLGVTDSMGRWSLASAPERLAFSHPDFVRETVSAATEVVLLKPGLTVRGVVVNELGRAIEGVRILGGDFPLWTPVDGRFVLSNCRPGTMVLVAERPGHAASALHWQVNPGGEEVRWLMPRAYPRRWRIVDSDRRPVPGAEVSVERWSAPVPWDWRWRADADGQVLWPGAPTGEVRFAVAMGGFRPLHGARLTAGQETCEVTLRRPRVVSGLVHDDSGAPVEDFAVAPGANRADGIVWDDERLLRGGAGRFVLPLPDETTAFVRVSSGGFESAVSRPVEANEESVSLQFTLRKAEPFAGFIQDEARLPVAGAEVVLLGPGERAVLERGSFADHAHLPSRRALTDATGRFRIGSCRDAIWLFAAQRGVGFGSLAFVEAQRSNAIVLHPWARIEGNLEFNGRPLTNQLVALGPLAMTNLSFHRNAFTALTDAAGGFAFEFVPPGLHSAGRIVRGFRSHTIAVEVEAGRTLHIKVGGNGTRVIGRLRVPGAKPLWEEGEVPAGLRQRRPDGLLATYEFEFHEAGAFVVEAVPPGDYELEAHWHEPARESRGEICHGAWRTNVIVPPRSEVDLGELVWQGPAVPAGADRIP